MVSDCERHSRQRRERPRKPRLIFRPSREFDHGGIVNFRGCRDALTERLCRRLQTFSGQFDSARHLHLVVGKWPSHLPWTQVSESSNLSSQTIRSRLSSRPVLARCARLRSTPQVTVQSLLPGSPISVYGSGQPTSFGSKSSEVRILSH